MSNGKLENLKLNYQLLNTLNPHRDVQLRQNGTPQSALSPYLFSIRRFDYSAGTPISENPKIYSLHNNHQFWAGGKAGDVEMMWLTWNGSPSQNVDYCDDDAVTVEMNLLGALRVRVRVFPKRVSILWRREILPWQL